MRSDGRAPSELRPLKIERNVLPNAEGSCILELGRTKILCTSTVQFDVPGFLKGIGEGWVSAEYFLHPRATIERNVRDLKGREPRSIEISRMIGRSLRGAVNRNELKENTIILDCEVLNADGGTRTACITAGFIALYDAIQFMLKNHIIKKNPIKEFIAGISAGVVNGEIFLDLTYEEDFQAQVDFNIAMLESGQFIEVQGTGEKGGVNEKEIQNILKVAKMGILQIIEYQRKILGVEKT